MVFFLKMGQPQPLFRLFLVFSNKHHYNFKINQFEKMSIQFTDQDSNPQPLEHESSPITTRPGLPPQTFVVFILATNYGYVTCSRKRVYGTGPVWVTNSPSLKCKKRTTIASATSILLLLCL